MPPWGPEIGEQTVDLLADVAVLQADVADDRTWADDDDGLRRRRNLIAAASTLRGCAQAMDLQATAVTLHEIAATTRAWGDLMREG